MGSCISANTAERRILTAIYASPEPALPTFQTSLRSASQATRDRHALLPSLSSQSQPRRPSSANNGVSYPQFDTTPYAAIDYGHSLSRQSSAQAQLGQVEQQLQEMRTSPSSLIDADALPRPSYGPTLGPQEVEVGFSRGALQV